MPITVCGWIGNVRQEGANVIMAFRTLLTVALVGARLIIVGNAIVEFVKRPSAETEAQTGLVAAQDAGWQLNIHEIDCQRM